MSNIKFSLCIITVCLFHIQCWSKSPLALLKTLHCCPEEDSKLSEGAAPPTGRPLDEFYSLVARRLQINTSVASHCGFTEVHCKFHDLSDLWPLDSLLHFSPTSCLNLTLQISSDFLFWIEVARHTHTHTAWAAQLIADWFIILPLILLLSSSHISSCL